MGEIRSRNIKKQPEVKTSVPFPLPKYLDEGSEEGFLDSIEDLGDDSDFLDGGGSNSGGLGVPTNIVIKSQTLHQTTGGQSSVDVVVSFDDVIGATNYETRITKVDCATGQAPAPTPPPPAGPTVRGATMAYVPSNPGTVSIPAGAQAGDLAILFAAHAWSASTPSGWAQENNLTGSNWNGAVFSKVLSSGDITTGSVTVTFATEYAGRIALAVMDGATGGIREVKAVRSSTGASPVTLTTDSSAVATDRALYFGSIRSDSSVTTVDRGSLLVSQGAGTQASAALYQESLSSAGPVSAQFSHSVATSGYYEAIVIVQAA